MSQLDFVDMDLEESDRCLYDSLTVLGDVEQTEEIGRVHELDVITPSSFFLSVALILFVLLFLSCFLIFAHFVLDFDQIVTTHAMCCVALLCGGSVPPAVLSYHNVMVLRFTSDSSITHRGFRASLAFISHTGTRELHLFPQLVNQFIRNAISFHNSGC